MRNKTTGWLSSPIFEENAENTRRTILPRAIIIIIMLFTVAVLVGDFLRGELAISTVIVSVMMFIAFFFLYRLKLTGGVLQQSEDRFQQIF